MFMILEERRQIHTTRPLLLLDRTERKGLETGRPLKAKSCSCKQTTEKIRVVLLSDLEGPDTVTCLLFVAIIEERGQEGLHAFW